MGARIAEAVAAAREARCAAATAIDKPHEHLSFEYVMK